MGIVDVENLNFLYDNTQQQVINNISMSVKKGEFVAVIGHNGSGKSTFAKLLNLLLTPSSGTIKICEVDTSNIDEPWKLRMHAGMVFQNPDNQIVATVVQEDVAFGLENIGIKHDDMQSIIDKSLKSVDMYDYADRAPHLLSGGQKQRIAIAGVLAMMPDVIIFDEATSMLDPVGRSEILSVVQKLNKEQNITIIWITHFMEEVTLADRVVVFNNGNIDMIGSPKEVFSNIEHIRSLGLDVPPMVELSEFLRQNQINIDKITLTIEDMVEELIKLNGNSNKKFNA